MRDILFRGQSIDRRKWYEGDLYQTRLKSVFYINYYTEHGDRMAVEVDPETVGQYTGITDKNGKKIFEGDILERKFTFDGSKKKEIQRGVILWREGWNHYAAFSGSDKKRLLFMATKATANTKDSEIEVIGNIHDNPELLEGGAE